MSVLGSIQFTYTHSSLTFVYTTAKLQKLGLLLISYLLFDNTEFPF